MRKIGIFYGPIGGTTEKVAKQIKDAFGNANVDIYPIRDSTAARVNLSDIVIFGCSTLGSETWDGERAKNCWNNFRPEIEKIDVNGKNTHPVFAYLKNKKGGLLGKNIKWNFTKFLIDATGKPIKRFGSTTKPEVIDKKLEKLFSI